MSETVIKPIPAPAPTAQPTQVAQQPSKVVISVQKVPAVVVDAEAAASQQTTNEFNNDAKNLIPNDNYLTSPLFYEIANFFGIEQSEYENAKDKLSVITDYVINEKNSNKVEDVMMGIRELEDKLQPPAWGEKRYNNLYKYLRIASKRDAFDKATKAFERGLNHV